MLLPTILAIAAVPVFASTYQGGSYVDLIQWEKLVSESPVDVVKRQADSTINFPSQCSASCSNVQGQLNSCTSYQCFCTTTNIVNLRGCFNCVGELRNNFEALQEAIDNMVGNCTAAGFTVPSQTLSGGGGVSSTRSGTTTTTGGGTTTSSSSTPLSTISSTGGGQTSKPIFSPVITVDPSQTTDQPIVGGGALAGASTTLGLMLSAAAAGVAFAIGVL